MIREFARFVWDNLYIEGGLARAELEDENIICFYLKDTEPGMLEYKKSPCHIDIRLDEEFWARDIEDCKIDLKEKDEDIINNFIDDRIKPLIFLKIEFEFQIKLNTKLY